MKKIYTILLLIFIQMAAVQIAFAQSEKVFLDSFAAIQKPIIRALNDSLTLAIQQKKIALSEISDSVLHKQQELVYNAEIRKIKESLKIEKKHYKTIKEDITIQLENYHKAQPHYRYKRLSKIFMFSGAAFGLSSVILLMPAMTHVPKQQHNGPNAYGYALLASTITAGGLF